MSIWQLLFRVIQDLSGFAGLCCPAVRFVTGKMDTETMDTENMHQQTSSVTFLVYILGEI